MAYKKNLYIDQGSSFVETFLLYTNDGEPINLTGAIVTAQIRKYPDDANAISFVCTVVGDGEISITLSPSATANVESGKYMWDLFVTRSSTDRKKEIEGLATISPSVTKV